MTAVPVWLGLVCLVVVLTWLLLRQRYLMATLLWFLVPAAWRLTSCLYIDHFGPVYAEELFREIGPGRASGLLALHYAVTLAVFAFALRRQTVSPASDRVRLGWFGGERAVLLVNAMWWASLAFLGGLYGELMWHGEIPALRGMERSEYAQVAGWLHYLFERFGNLFAIALGVGFVAPTRLGLASDRRFLGLLVALLAYALLTGHRYSTFFRFSTLFLVPLTVLLIPGHRGAQPGQHRRKRTAILGVASVVGIVLTMIVAAVTWSYFVVRHPEMDVAWSKLRDRLLVEQAELWVLTHERVVEQGRGTPDTVAELLFIRPLDPNRNTTITYLMWRALGGDAHRVLAQGQQYTGGYPEVFVELFGAWGSLAASAVFASLMGLLLRLLILCVLDWRPLTLACAASLFYALAITYWGGMLNFILMWTFWIKGLGLVIAWWLDERGVEPQRLTALRQQELGA